MLTVTRNDAQHRYELDDDGRVVGQAVYHERDGRRVFTHTEVDEGHEGEGYGSTLARGALDDARAQGIAVVPLCPFISGWIDRHDEYADLVDGGMLERLRG